MSIENIKAVWDHSRQSGTKRLVMIALADMANADGYCWPSIPLIARMCKCTNRYIMKIIPELEASGELYVDHRPGRTRGNIYMLTLNVSVDSFAKRLIHYLDYGPTEALSIALTHLGKGEHESQIVNPSSPLPQKLKVNNSREKVNNSREKVNNSREKVNPSSPDPIEPIGTVIEPSFIDQGVKAARVDPTPPPATPKVLRLPNDSYEIPNPPTNGHATSTEPTQKQLQRWAPQVEPRKFRNGYIPAGAGTTPTEVWYESFAVTTAETRLTAPDQYDLRNCTDLDKLRTIVATFRQCDFKRKKNIRLILDWYRDGIPDKYLGASANGAGTGFGLTAYAEKERKQYERDYGPDEELTPEKEQWIWEQKRKLAAQNSGV